MDHIVESNVFDGLVPDTFNVSPDIIMETTNTDENVNTSPMATRSVHEDDEALKLDKEKLFDCLDTSTK